MTRQAHILINWQLLGMLKIYAELHSLDCAETALEQIIRERVDQQPEIADLYKMRDKARKEVDAAWRKKYAINQEPADEIP